MRSYLRLPDLCDGIVQYHCQSNRGIYRIHVDTQTGECVCNCPAFECNKRPAAEHREEEITYLTPQYHCPHIARVVDDLVQRGELSFEPTSEE